MNVRNTYHPNPNTRDSDMQNTCIINLHIIVSIADGRYSDCANLYCIKIQFDGSRGVVCVVTVSELSWSIIEEPRSHRQTIYSASQELGEERVMWKEYCSLWLNYHSWSVS
jgi:hypothetical protein